MAARPAPANEWHELQGTLLDAVEQAVIATDVGGGIIYWNRFAERLYGWRADEVLGRNILKVTPAAEHDAFAAEIMTRLQAGESWSGELHLRRRDGSVFPAHVTDSPILGADGRLVGVVGVSMDVSERRRAEKRLRLLAAELDHRVKNTLATVQAVARLTIGDGEVADALEGRLRALAGAHDLLAQARWSGARLGVLVDAALAIHRGRVAVQGRDLLLTPKAAEAFALILHELATNAAKYGALSVPSGRVEISWSGAAAGAPFAFQWLEREGPAVVPPSRRGFGIRMIERSALYELNGKARLDFRPEGVSYRLEAPSEAIVSSDAA